MQYSSPYINHEFAPESDWILIASDIKMHILALIFSLMMALETSMSHSTSWGYSNNCANDCTSEVDVTVWSGTYHHPASDHLYYYYAHISQNEGNLLYTPVDSTSGASTGSSISVPFDLITEDSKPSGLTDGVTQFYADHDTVGLVHSTGDFLGRKYPNSYQGVSIHVAQGYYNLRYDPSSSFDSVFAPFSGILNGITVYVGCNGCAPGGNALGFPSVLASSVPTSAPSPAPSPVPLPSFLPTVRPSQPTGQPTGQPSSQPSSQPTAQPTGQPTTQPSSQPSGQPTGQPTGQPSSRPSPKPTHAPTKQHPTAFPSRRSSKPPTIKPTSSRMPSTNPSRYPIRTQSPTQQPMVRKPTSFPTKKKNLAIL